MQPRSVASIESATRTLEGDGFPVRRALAGAGESTRGHDPFLLLDEIGPVDWQPGQAVGAGDQPRRGFESITYLLSGELEHRDSLGNRATLGSGGLHWLNAGSGVVQSESPTRELVDAGGRVHGFSLWVNLPRRAKAQDARFRPVAGDRLPSYRSDDGASQVKLLVGECGGLVAPVRTVTPLLLLHATVAPGGTLRQPVPGDYHACAYVFGGSVRCGASQVASGQLINLTRDGGWVELTATGSDSAQILLFGGPPIREPVARYGSFVMTTTDEIVEAFDDYRAGRLGAASAALASR